MIIVTVGRVTLVAGPASEETQPSDENLDALNAAVESEPQPYPPQPSSLCT